MGGFGRGRLEGFRGFVEGLDFRILEYYFRGLSFLLVFFGRLVIFLELVFIVFVI